MGTKSAWPKERRERQAQVCRATKPWERATGPRTDEGKARSSRNADKGVATSRARLLQVRLDWRTAREAELDALLGRPLWDCLDSGAPRFT